MTDSTQIAALVAALKNGLKAKQILQDVPMSRYTTLRLGGNADVLVEISSVEDLQHSFAAASAVNIPVTLLGNGSNLLITDCGLRGLAIHMGDSFADISAPAALEDGRFEITAMAGASLQKLCNAAADYGLAGMEFASGIPGSVGGAAYMNAGAYGGEMKDIITSVTICSPKGQITTYSVDEMDYSYRHSRLMEGSGDAVVSINVALYPGDQDIIRAAMREFNAKRREKQPVNIPSCGSTFKRPQGNFAGTLIEQCGLKGLRVGGCSVSTLHAGFLLNDQNGTATDYLRLIHEVQNRVFGLTGILLEPEVQILGELPKEDEE